MQQSIDYTRAERRGLIERLAEAYRPPRGSRTSSAACVAVLRCIESHLGRDARGALADSWRLTTSTLAAETGLSPRAVGYAVRQLERDLLLYVTEHRATGWRAHSYRVIWSNVEAAAQSQAEPEATEPELPAVIERDGVTRAVAPRRPAPPARPASPDAAPLQLAPAPLQLAPPPLQLAPPPLQLGVATVATRSSNRCNSCLPEPETTTRNPPPPPTSSTSSGGAWREVEEALRRLGIGQAAETVAAARARGAEPADAREALEEWRSSPGLWRPGGLAWRIARGVWPPPDKAAAARLHQANELRERLAAEGRRRGMPADLVAGVIGKALGHRGLAEFLRPEERRALEAAAERMATR